MGYRLINGEATYIDSFLTRYFDQMGLEKDRFNDMLESGKFDVFTPTPSEIHHEGEYTKLLYYVYYTSSFISPKLNDIYGHHFLHNRFWRQTNHG